MVHGRSPFSGVRRMVFPTGQDATAGRPTDSSHLPPLRAHYVAAGDRAGKPDSTSGDNSARRRRVINCAKATIPEATRVGEDRRELIGSECSVKVITCRLVLTSS
jgi:hypothetical protein